MAVLGRLPEGGAVNRWLCLTQLGFADFTSPEVNLPGVWCKSVDSWRCSHHESRRVDVLISQLTWSWPCLADSQRGVRPNSNSASHDFGLTSLEVNSQGAWCKSVNPWRISHRKSRRVDISISQLTWSWPCLAVSQRVVRPTSSSVYHGLIAPIRRVEQSIHQGFVANPSTPGGVATAKEDELTFGLVN